LSSQIKALERTLGVQLLIRTTRSVRLTAAGEKFFRRARRLIIDLDTVVTEMRQPIASQRGVVTFACIPTIAGYLFPRIIDQYKKKHPDVIIEMLDDATVEMERRILNRDAD